VLRRILRRAVLIGRYLGFGSEGFLDRLAPTVVAEFSPVFPELKRHETKIVDVLRSEEALFNRTLDRGLRIFEDAVAGQRGKEFSAEVAFKLSDTYGFPVDLTEVLARERGLTLDLQKVEALLEQQRERSRAAQEKEAITAVEEGVATEFVGFDQDETRGHVVSLVQRDGAILAAVDRSPFYAEMGGQVSDTGEIRTASGGRIRVDHVAKQGRTFYLRLAEPLDAPLNSEIVLAIDRERRRQIEANHTATHLLHWALHEVVSRDVSQKGSYVGPDRLRFDFNSQPLTPEQIAAVERLVNARVIANDAVSWIEVPYAEVKARTDIMQFFGEKYGERVRVVQIGGNAGRLDGYSMELCGGTHVLRTGQLGLFRIVSEGAISAGVRRIEAVTGLASYDYVRHVVAEKETRLQALQQEVVELKKQLERERTQALQREANGILARLDLTRPVLVERVAQASGDLLQGIANALKARAYDGVAVLLAPGEAQVAVQVYVGPRAAQTYHAGKLTQEICGWLGGKGGGRPDLARGMGKEPGKVDEVLARLRKRFG
jgi:alanyl-tRNA synthetase